MATYNVSTTFAITADYDTTDAEDRQFSVTIVEVSNTTDVRIVSIEAS